MTAQKTQLEYIQNGEPLVGYIQENNVGSLNRTSSQLLNIIELLKLDIQQIKNNLAVVPNNDSLEENDEYIKIADSIETLQRVSGKKFTDQDNEIRLIKEEIDKIKKNRPTNFLDYSLVRSLEELVRSLEVKVYNLEIQKSYKSEDESVIKISEESLAPIISELNLLDAKIRGVKDEIGIYDSESNTGSGLKNRVHQLFILAKETKEKIDRYADILQVQQQTIINDLIDEKIVPYKIRLGQHNSISMELNQRIALHEKRLQSLFEKYNISEDLLENTDVSSLLKSIKLSSENANQNAETALRNSETALQSTEQNSESLSQVQEYIDTIKEKIGNLDQIENSLIENILDMSSKIGTPEEENTIIGKLSKIDILKYEFSENIQNINMLIGSNVPGSETGIYRLLNESRSFKNIYYKMTITNEMLDRYNEIQFIVPEYIQNKGNNFIIRRKKDLKLFSSDYNIDTKMLKIVIEPFQNDRDQNGIDIIILPITIEDLQLSNINISGIEKQSNVIDDQDESDQAEE